MITLPGVDHGLATMANQSSDAIERILWIGYTTHAEAVAKGLFVPAEPWTYELVINFRKQFTTVMYAVPFGKVDIDMSYTAEIRYLERGRLYPRLPKWLRLVFELPAVIRFLDRCAKECRPQVIQVCGPHIPAFVVWLVPRLWRIPKMCFIEAFWEDLLRHQAYMSKIVKIAMPLWYGLVYKIFDGYIGCPSLKPDFYTRRGMARNRIHPWVQPVDVDRIAALDPRDAPEIVRAAPGPRIVTVGRLHPEKLSLQALEVFLLLAARGFPGSLVFVGDGPLRQEIACRAQAAGLAHRVIMTGALPYTAANRAVKACQYYLATMQGSALIEAMAAGLPIVAYDHDTHAALIQDGVTGILVPAGQPEAAAAALAALQSDPKRAARLGAVAAAEIRRRYDPETVARILAEPLQRVGHRLLACHHG